MSIRTALFDAFGELVADVRGGDTATEQADKVATVLRQAGISGYRYSASACPVALFLRARAQWNIQTAVTYVSWAGDGPERMTIPAPVQYFISRFDAEQYPDLDAGTTSVCMTADELPA